jgi:hypothetical protein
MYVQPTIKMASLIKEVMPTYQVQQVKLDARQYKMLVDYDIYTGTGDYDYKTDTYKVIEIIYPAEYYAMPTYINTETLKRIYKNSDKTFQGFKTELINELAV